MAAFKLIKIPQVVDGIQYVTTCHVYEKENVVTVNSVECNYQARCTKGVHCSGVCIGIGEGKLNDTLKAEGLKLLPLYEVMNS